MVMMMDNEWGEREEVTTRIGKEDKEADVALFVALLFGSGGRNQEEQEEEEAGG